MKLRIKGNSLRLRLSRSEVARVLAGSSVEETIQFTPAPGASLTYALESASNQNETTVSYVPQRVTVVLSRQHLLTWGDDSQVGIYTSVPAGEGESLEVIIEKDFACLDRSEQENSDTFANPHTGSVC